MGAAKDIILRPISRQDADALIKRVHYSGKVVNNSQLHIGVFYQGRLEGAMQFGPSLDKRKIVSLVEGTGWNEFIELNRMAFSDALPRNSESRALSIAMRMLRQHAPQLKWVVSFADATQCGDGTIYRAAGFVLTGIKKNESLYLLPDGTSIHEWQLRVNATAIREQAMALSGGAASLTKWKEYTQVRPLEGFQLRYIYFLDPTARERLTVPVLPFSEIERRGAGMYKGERVTRGSGETDNAPQPNEETGGASPTEPLLLT